MDVSVGFGGIAGSIASRCIGPDLPSDARVRDLAHELRLNDGAVVVVSEIRRQSRLRCGEILVIHSRIWAWQRNAGFPNHGGHIVDALHIYGALVSRPEGTAILGLSPVVRDGADRKDGVVEAIDLHAGRGSVRTRLSASGFRHESQSPCKARGLETSRGLRVDAVAVDQAGAEVVSIEDERCNSSDSVDRCLNQQACLAGVRLAGVAGDRESAIVAGQLNLTAEAEEDIATGLDAGAPVRNAANWPDRVLFAFHSHGGVGPVRGTCSAASGRVASLQNAEVAGQREVSAVLNVDVATLAHTSFATHDLLAGLEQARCPVQRCSDEVPGLAGLDSTCLRWQRDCAEIASNGEGAGVLWVDLFTQLVDGFSMKECRARGNYGSRSAHVDIHSVRGRAALCFAEGGVGAENAHPRSQS